MPYARCKVDIDFEINGDIAYAAHLTGGVLDLHAIVNEFPEKVAAKFFQAWSRIECFARLDMRKVSHMLCCSPSVSPVHARQ